MCVLVAVHAWPVLGQEPEQRMTETWVGVIWWMLVWLGQGRGRVAGRGRQGCIPSTASLMWSLLHSSHLTMDRITTVQQSRVRHQRDLMLGSVLHCYPPGPL